MLSRWFAHVDMDAFYASVEVLDRPELAGLPVAVGGPSSQRGVIAAASYPARRYGVRSAMPTGQAVRLCPDLVLLPGRMSRYQEKSREVMSILREQAPAVEPLSLDEASLDLTGCARIHGDWEAFALRLQRRILDETGLWSSVGLGETRRIAKIASDLRKPQGRVVVEAGQGAAFLQSLPVSRLWGVGPKLQARLAELGFHRGEDLARTPRTHLRSLLGKMGPALQDAVLAVETGRVVADRAARSISHENTFARDRVGYGQLEPVLLRQAGQVATRLRKRRVRGRIVQLKIRNRGFQTLTRRTTLAQPIDHAMDIHRAACGLLRALDWETVPVRLVGVGVQDLVSAGSVQPDLFGTVQRASVLDSVMDRVQDRFGSSSLTRAGTLVRPESGSPASAHPWQDDVYAPLDAHGLGETPEHPAPPDGSSHSVGRGLVAPRSERVPLS